MWKAFMALALAASFGAQAADAPEVHKKYGVRYVSGGIDAEQRKAMAKIGPKFPIHLHFVVEGSNAPISGVKVTARDVTGNLYLEAESEGPLFFFDATGGRFTIEAQYKGEKLSETKDLVGRRYLLLEYKFRAGS